MGVPGAGHGIEHIHVASDVSSLTHTVLHQGHPPANPAHSQPVVGGSFQDRMKQEVSPEPPWMGSRRVLEDPPGRGLKRR